MVSQTVKAKDCAVLCTLAIPILIWTCMTQCLYENMDLYDVLPLSEDLRFVHGDSVSDNIIILGDSVVCALFYQTVFIILIDNVDLAELCVAAVDTVNSLQRRGSSDGIRVTGIRLEDEIARLEIRFIYIVNLLSGIIRGALIQIGFHKFC